ncbi:mitochondrial potassium channel-like isoform X1 [Amphibalanus amphitrite]|uniref:mitochondrial potassium channel-like isoform X1 n=1 Tax=Amphibalanus amphitrite TaxID=1232801 RepID=UPI001C925978|nr:mitochondrial potassium channel-like isoform X1 [Amphibalanus amphitrite]XP_043188397.1 mitochondrial potassium channel-like isoform X1 [Amphibalanus amphitrite]XP_043188399.1 mitochondrial potassium channel-like isoform X1 [Amphibalanus amphitrite]XP_043188400.1 mitochondrial potassium channel-like isoform X1 [Amphibalanus amphitrite]XP_043188402.1 mitochondrial potassium channel-like isoform X1 [Amphibalanus amphitrite]XP_043188403.1 mitochondrial potassium channel-like isoform X1 [Amphib
MISSTLTRYTCSNLQKGVTLCKAHSRLSSSSVHVEGLKDKFGSLMKSYEQYIGIAEVTAAQNRVIEAEELFLRAQAQRREHQIHMNHIQAKLKDLHAEIAKTSRGEDRYLALVTEEHRVLREESRLSSEYKLLEKAEQELFSALSNAVRTSHEKERAQAEKTKYWSIIGSAIGAFIGIVGTSINNWLRMRELRSIASSSAEVPVKLQEDVAVLTSSVEHQQNEVKKAMHSIEALFSSLPLSAISHGADGSAGRLPLQLGERFAAEVSAQLERLEQQQAGLRRELTAGWQQAAAGGADSESVQLLLMEHERRVERRLMHASAALATVGVVCGAALAVAVSRAFGG